MSRNLPDYADWLTPVRLRREERAWKEVRLFEQYAAAVQRIVREHPDITAITEFGCGTGWVPSVLDLKLPYTLIDRNRWCLRAARIRNAQRPWVQVVPHEIRTLDPTTPLVCGFAVLKHFRLPEWQELFIRLFSGATYGLFTMPIAKDCMDDGIEFTHTRITEEFLSDCLQLAGHRELWRDMKDPEEPLFATVKFD